jgi:hypothetical protein
MGNAIKFIKNKLCKTCNKELYFENFRKVKPLLFKFQIKVSILDGQISIEEKDLIDAKNVNTKNNKYNII